MTQPYLKYKTSSDGASIDPLYSLARAIFFKMDPERAHDLALKTASLPFAGSLIKHRYKSSANPTKVLNLDFENQVGLAAGLDKNGDYIDALGAMGFGHIEIGTVTPKPQPGNPTPRMFRLTEHQALINRMGFNNLGVDHLLKRAEARKYKGVLGINIGKNANTPLEKANDDYLHCLQKVYPVADYITVNVSSPNTQGLRELQHGQLLRQLLQALKDTQSKLATEHNQYRPILIKIAPDMSESELADFTQAVLEHEIDGVIAGNTTNERQKVADSEHAAEQGGLSGAPVRELSNTKLALVRQLLGPDTVLVGVGGILEARHAQEKRDFGADLVQLYTGLIYRGPALVRDCIRTLA